MTDVRPSHAKPDALRPSRGYIRSLDGLRAVAVFSVVASHAGLPHTAGGKTGVLLFFVISGFVITGILVKDLEQRGRVRVGIFYARRALRLLPALVLATAAYAAVSLFVAPGTRNSTETLLALPAALLYFLNWFDIAVGPESGVGFLGHYWSLSVEEQFYIVWPFLLWLAYKIGRVKAVMWTALVGAALSYALKWIVVADGHRQTGTDFAADALLIGCAIAAAKLAYTPRWKAPTAVPWVALVVLVSALALGNSSSTATVAQDAIYARLWWPLAVIASAALIWTSVQGALARPLRAILEWRPIVYLGRISYGIYLWHILLIFLFTSELHLTGIIRLAAILGATVAIAALSYQFVEKPFLRLKPGGLGPESPLPTTSGTPLPVRPV